MRCLLRLLGALALAACATSAPDVRLPGAEGDGHVARLVIDARTGRPLRGATLRLHREVIEPGAPLAPLVAEFTADRFGLVSVPWREEYFDCHWVYEHPGYAPHDDYPGAEETVELVPGADHEGRVLGADGPPQGGIAVELYLGCPHSPAVRRAVTDGDGRFRLTAIDPLAGSLWAPRPGALARAESVVPIGPGRLAPLRSEPAGSAHGRVRDRAGRPLAGVTAYSTHFPRGPRATTGADGRFVLHGVPAGAEVAFFDPHGRALAPEIERLPPPDAASPETAMHRVEVTPPGDTAHYLWRLADGDFHEDATAPPILLETPHQGRLWLEFEHELHGSGRIPVEVAGAVSRVGPDAFPAPRAAAVGGPAGEAVPDAEVSVWHAARWVPVPATSWLLQDGAYVRLDRQDDGGGTWMPRRLRLEGDGPYVLRLGAAALDLRVEPASFTVLVDGEVVGGTDGRLLLRGLARGRHEVLVGAPGFRTRALALDLDGLRVVRVRLPER